MTGSATTIIKLTTSLWLYILAVVLAVFGHWFALGCFLVSATGLLLMALDETGIRIRPAAMWWRRAS